MAVASTKAPVGKGTIKQERKSWSEPKGQAEALVALRDQGLGWADVAAKLAAKFPSVGLRGTNGVRVKYQSVKEGRCVSDAAATAEVLRGREELRSKRKRDQEERAVERKAAKKAAKKKAKVQDEQEEEEEEAGGGGRSTVSSGSCKGGSTSS
eukprot:COSAG01_NODE_3171_length_6469_cov_9.978022_2_plen_153_part_00